MFETIALGRVAAEREESRRSGPVGDEDVMIICLPREASGVLGAIVGHLSLLSPWQDDGDQDFWDDPWHEADEARSYNDYGDDDQDFWIDGPSASMTDNFVGDLQMGSGRRVPGLPPGLFCCSPDIGYDLWHGTYAMEPALWGKYSFRALPGDSGPQQWGAGGVGRVRRDGDTFATKTVARREKMEAKLARVATRFAREAAKFADGPVDLNAEEGTVNIPILVGRSASAAYDNIAAAAKNAASRDGLYWSGGRVGDGVLITFAADPTTQLANYSIDGLAAVGTLLAALSGDIDCGHVVPLGNGQFGVAGVGVGNIFKKIGEAFKGKGDKSEKLKKKMDKLWTKFSKLNDQLEAEGGDRYEPWSTAAAKAAAIGSLEVGRGGGGRKKAKRAMRQIKQQRQQQQQPPPEEEQAAPAPSSDSSTTRLLQQILAAQQQQAPARGGRGGGGRQQQQPQPQFQPPYTPIPIPQIRPQVSPFAPPAYGAYQGYGYQGHMPQFVPVMGMWEDGGNAWSEGEASLAAEWWG